ncbi:interleukin-2 receptor subunit beta isoform X2 [Phascolarctos cinereus]|uniref:Interleukin-2 receptor subunit beta n=1 Tax=Phascolarctos cinereus TaxID=38626 RepID=A0A6P5JZF1_PHACI|nr:interleukin-2 receptor subunit beta isoform X2 [Phascolarctos cinereus]
MQTSLQMGPHTQLHPVGVTTCSPLSWYLPLFLLLLVLPWIQGALKDSPQLSCFYNSKANISCTWKPEPTLRVEQCHLYGTSKRQQPANRSCELLRVMPTLWTCDLILGEIDSQPLTVVDVLVMKVSCLIGGQRMVMQEEFRPFEKIRLMALSDLCLIQQEEHASNVSWAVPLCSHYLEDNLVFEARYKIQGSSWEKATMLPINQNQRWVYIEKLSPGTKYEFQVRGKPEIKGASAFWSPWSQTLIFQTKPQVSTFKWLIHIIMGLCGVVSIFLVLLLVPKWYSQKWLKKVLKCHIPDPSKFFSSLSTEHGGDFQKWLSSPFPIASFTTSVLAPEISPLEVMQKEDPNLGLLLSKELVPAYRSPETSGHSLSSCFTNQGYFFFHLPDALEVESCQVYFTYSPFSEEEEENKEEGEQGSLVPQLPPGGPEDDSYCTFPPGDDMILFSPRVFQGPGNNLGPQSISFSGKEAKKETSPPEEDTAATPSCDPSFSRSKNSLDSRPESTQDGGLPLGTGLGPASPFPWDVPPTPDQTHAVSSSYSVLNTGAYLSLGEFQNQYHTHSA